VQAARTFLSFDGDDLVQKEFDTNDSSTRFKHHYLNKAISILSCSILNGELFASSHCYIRFTPELGHISIWPTFPERFGIRNTFEYFNEK
jgi:hypothetical protein